MSRCSGHCCRAFILTTPLIVIKDMAVKNPNNHEYNFIAENFFEIGVGNPTVMDRVEFRNVDASAMLHSCRQYDHDTGNCKAYDRRPLICRNHPEYNDPFRTCKSDGCTYNSRRDIQANSI